MLYPWSSSLESPSTLHRIQSSSSHSTSHPSVKPHRLSLPSSPQRGDSFRSMSFVLDPPSSPKQFVRIFRRPPSIVDVQDIRPRDSTLVFNVLLARPFFFKPRPSICPRFTSRSRKSRLFFWFCQFLLSFGIPARIGRRRRDDVF